MAESLINVLGTVGSTQKNIKTVTTALGGLEKQLTSIVLSLQSLEMSFGSVAESLESIRITVEGIANEESIPLWLETVGVILGGVADIATIGTVLGDIDLSGITTSLSSLIEMLGRLDFSGITDSLSSLVSSVGVLLGTMRPDVLLLFGGALLYVRGIIDAVVEGLNWLNSVVIPLGSTLLGTAIGFMVGGPYGGAIGAAIGLLVGLLTDAITAIIQNWNKIVTKISNFFAAMKEIYKALKIWFSYAMPDWLNNGFIGTVNSVIGINLKSLAPVKIPLMAQGAVLPANRPFLAVVGDQKHGTNVEAPLDTIKQAVAEVMAGQGSGDVVINFTGDLAQLARVLKPVIDRENRRVGVSLAKGVV